MRIKRVRLKNLSVLMVIVNFNNLTKAYFFGKKLIK